MASNRQVTEHSTLPNLAALRLNDEQPGRNINTSNPASSQLQSALCSSCADNVTLDRASSWSAGNIVDVQRAARAGCRFCSFLDVALELQVQTQNKGTDWAQQTPVLLNRLSDEARITLEPQPNKPTPGVEHQDVSLTIDTQHSDESGDIDRRPEATDQACKDLAKGWLDNCLENHETCSAVNPSVLPTRIIDVGDVGEQNDDIIRLLEPDKDTKDRYVALSYCWGTGATLTTTPEELPRLLEGFSVTELPKTLQEAVGVTRDLGFRFLWIDALCILQGRSEAAFRDWTSESARMGQVYSNATITIAASASSSCDQGLFHKRTCQIPYPNSSRDGTQEPTLVTLRIDGYPRWYQDEPILKRAWAFQERLLSRRILSYCYQDMMWHCGHGMTWERRPPGYVHRTHKERLRPGKFNWDIILLNYNSRSLTKPKDKLPALSAVAKRYQLATDDQYVAGIWQNDLPQALLWMHTEIGSMYQPRIQPFAPSAYRAPSWSWASLDSNIWYWPYSDVVATVLDHSVTLASTDPFGMISAASLTLECPCLDGNLAMDDIMKFYIDGQVIATTWPDEDEFIRREDADTSAPVTAALVVKKPYHYGLVLRPSRSSPTKHIRVGMFCSTNASFWDFADTRTLTLI